MRFAAVNVPKEQQQQPRTPAAELIRRLVAGEAVRAQPVPRQQDLPVELDQRVRLVGEW